MQYFVSVLLFAVVSFAFTYFDVEGFGVLVQSLNDSPEATRAYRICQVMFQFSLYGVLASLGLWHALAGFAFAHWAFGCDWLYYVVRGEDYTGYDPIDWFKISLPQLLSKLIRDRYIRGSELRYIGPVAIGIGLVISVL